LADRRAQLARDLLGVGRAGGDDEARVVTGERADDLRVLEPVERPGDRRGRAELRLDDDDVLGRGRADAELPQDALERLPRVWAAVASGQHVPRAAERVARLLQAQLPDVARDRRLRDGAAGPGQRLGEP